MPDDSFFNDFPIRSIFHSFVLSLAAFNPLRLGFSFPWRISNTPSPGSCVVIEQKEVATVMDAPLPRELCRNTRLTFEVILNEVKNLIITEC